MRVFSRFFSRTRSIFIVVGLQAGLCRNGGLRLVLRERFKNRLPDPVLGRGVGNRPQQGEASAFAVDRILARWKCDVPAATRAALPDAEADQLQPVQDAFSEMELRVGEFARAPVCLFAGSP